MLLVQTILVYVLLAAILAGACHLARVKKTMLPLYFVLVIYAVVMGVRYGVGFDYFGYCNFYADIQRGFDSLNVERMEVGFVLIARTLASLKCDTPVFLGVVALLQLLWVILAFKNEKRILQCILLVFILGGTVLQYANGLRQILAVGLWILAVRYAVERKVVQYYALVLIAFTMHKSAMLLFVMYPLLAARKEWVSNVKVQLVALVLALVLMRVNVVQMALSQMDALINFLGYSAYIDAKSKLIDQEVEFGMGFMCMLLTNVVVILHSNRMKKYFASWYITRLYDLYFIGLIVGYTFINSQLIGRVNYYFSYMDYLIIGATMCYGYYKDRKLYWTLIALTMIKFIGNMSKADVNTAMYVFNWQKEYFHYKTYLPF